MNIVFQRMKSELDETKEKLEQAQNDLSAWKFTPDRYKIEEGGGGGITVMPGAYPRGVESLGRTIVIYIYIYDL